MPYMEDGTPVDLVFNPLGVPSRMNLGQILETHLGLAAYKRGVSYVTPVFDSATEAEIKKLLSEVADEEISAKKEAGDEPDRRALKVLERARKLGVVEDELDTDDTERALTRSGKTILYDGRTGEAIDAPIVIGVMYVMKLYHMVEDKMHARSTGPYSLITQQPLGGKAQLAVSVWVRWNVGLCKRTARPTPCKKCSPLSQTILTDATRPTKPLSKETTFWNPPFPSPSRCWLKSCTHSV